MNSDPRSTTVHISVLPKETIGHLNAKPGDRIIDGTLGGGGHNEQLA